MSFAVSGAGFSVGFLARHARLFFAGVVLRVDGVRVLDARAASIGAARSDEKSLLVSSAFTCRSLPERIFRVVHAVGFDNGLLARHAARTGPYRQRSRVVFHRARVAARLGWFARRIER